MPPIDLSCGDLRLGLDPGHGAVITRFGRVTGAGEIPILAAHAPLRHPADSALFPMVPFANRARGNRLQVEGRSFALTPNTDDPLALHGLGWQRPWVVTGLDARSCRLSLDLGAEDLFACRADYAIALDETGLRLEMSLTNTGAGTIPAGLGFHPFFPRLPDTSVSFTARSLWPEGPGHLPTGRGPVPGAEDYTRLRPLPETWRNQCYSGWNGTAHIRQPTQGHALTLTADGLEALMFFAAPDQPRFAIEPQSHVSGETATGGHGLTALAPGERLTGSMVLDLRLLEGGADDL